MRETVQATNSSVVIDHSRSFLLTVQLLQHVRGGCINEVKRPVQELGRLKRGGGLFSGGYGIYADILNGVTRLGA